MNIERVKTLSVGNISLNNHIFKSYNINSFKQNAYS